LVCGLSGAVPSASKEELMVMTVAEIVGQLIKAHEEGREINLNK
jgi:hypothetical protein